MSIKGIIFDLYGTLIDSATKVYTMALEDAGGPVIVGDYLTNSSFRGLHDFPRLLCFHILLLKSKR